MADKLVPIDFGSYPVLPYWTEVRGPLFEILATLQNRIDRELRAELEARAKGLTTWLLTHLRVAQQTYEVVEEISALAKSKSISLRASVSIPPLARVLVDSLFATTFVFENPSDRMPWFWKSTWREIVEDLAGLTQDYGQDPAWQDWLKRLANERDAWQKLLDEHGTPLTSAQLATPSTVRFWPNPGKMVGLAQDAARKATLAYLNVRFYGNLSGASHLSGVGILAQGSVFLDEPTDDRNKKYFSDQVLTAMTILFALVTQLTLEVEKTPALARRVQKLWQVKNLWGIALEVYDRCYKTGLEALAAK